MLRQDPTTDPSTKTCTKCGETKPFEAFNKDKNRKFGLNSRCKPCQSVSQRAGYAAHAEKRRQYARDRRAADPEKFRQQRRARREANPDKFRQQDRARRETNPEHYRQKDRERYARDREKRKAQIRAARAANPEHYRAYDRARREANPDKFRQQDRARKAANPERYREAMRKWHKRNQAWRRQWMEAWYAANPDKKRQYQETKNRRARERYASDLEMRKHAAIRSDIRRARKVAVFVEPVDIEVLYQRDKGICSLCHEKVPRQEASIDHIIPLTAPHHPRKEHSYANCALAHRRCNSGKCNRAVTQQMRLF